MEERPWLKLILVIAGFAAMGWPVWQLTHPLRVAAMEETGSTATASETLSLQLSFATPPLAFSISEQGKILATAKNPASDFHLPLLLSIPAEGTDLLLKVTWPPGTSRTAVQVRISQNGNSRVDQTFWAQDNLVEIITLPGRQP